MLNLCDLIHLLYHTYDSLRGKKASVAIKEGSEPEAFWKILGGKTEYPKEKVSIITITSTTITT